MRTSLVLAGLTSILSVVACAMPTVAEIAKVKPVVDELVKSDLDDLKAERKSVDQVAETLIGYVKDAEQEAAKFLLLRKAFGLYLADGALDKAYNVVNKMMPVHVRDCNLDTFNERIGCAFAVRGEWKHAIMAFEQCSGKQGEIAKWEKMYPKTGPSSLTTGAVGDFWWEKAEKYAASPKIAAALRAHAVSWLKEALKDDSLRGLKKKLAEKRVAGVCETSKEGSASRVQPAEKAIAPKIVKERKEKGLYMIVDLTKLGRSAVSYLDETPKDGWADEYRTNKIAFRKIAPGSFNYMPGKSFVITKPFYIGIFEVTQKQYETITKVNPSEFKGDMRPVERVSYLDIRGKKEGVNWPRDNRVDGDSYLGQMRQRFGLEFDLPTEAQWEYACRAGTTGDFNVDGVEMVKLGKCQENGGEVDHHVKVGSFLPNAWGLYDMHGNVWEWCLDRVSSGGGRVDWPPETRERETDPRGPEVGKARVRRGGAWISGAYRCRSSRRGRNNADGRGNNYGFRLVCPQEIPDTITVK